MMAAGSSAELLKTLELRLGLCQVSRVSIGLNAAYAAIFVGISIHVLQNFQSETHSFSSQHQSERLGDYVRLREEEAGNHRQTLPAQEKVLRRSWGRWVSC